MKRLIIILLFLASLVLFSACVDLSRLKTRVVTLPATKVSCQNALLEGQYSSGPIPDNVVVGFIYSTDMMLENGNNYYVLTAETRNEDGTFSVNTLSLLPDTIYYFNAIFQKDGKIVTGYPEAFQTPGVSTLIQYEGTTDIAETVATLHACLDLTNCYQDQLEYGFQVAAPDGKVTAVPADNLADGRFSATVTGLTPFTDYSVSAYATFSVKYYYNSYFGVQETYDRRTYSTPSQPFQSTALEAEIVFPASPEVTETNATLSCEFNILSPVEINRRIVTVYYSSTLQTLSELVDSGSRRDMSTAADGTFSQTLTGLQPHTTYYYVVVALADGTRFESEVRSFTTADYTFTLTADPVSDNIFTSATLNGTLTVNSVDPLNKQVWFRYSDTAASVDELVASGNSVSSSLSDSSFSSTLHKLKETTTYYYIACARVHNDVIYSSNVQSFTTGEHPESPVRIIYDDVTDITVSGATFSGRVEVIDPGVRVSRDARLFYGVKSSEGDWPPANVTSEKSLPIMLYDSGAYSLWYNHLSSGTNYWYLLAVEVDGELVMGDFRFFSTQEIQMTLSNVEASEIECGAAKLSFRLSVNDIGNVSRTVNFYYSPFVSDAAALLEQGSILTATPSSDGLYSANLKDLNRETKYYFVAVVQIYDKTVVSEVCTFTTIPAPIPEAVDMGLSVKWASQNLASSSPEGAGGWFAWGDTLARASFSWAEYPFCKGDYNLLTKYCTVASYGTVDNLQVLLPEDDAASVLLGGGWRIPTWEEWAELMDTENCTWQWVSQNGASGYRVTSNRTGNSIFLPAAGYRDDIASRDLSSGYYWSATLHPTGPFYGWSMEFNSNSVVGRRPHGRCKGLSIRPVLE